MLRSLTVVIFVFTVFAIWTVYTPEQLEAPAHVVIEKGATVDSIVDELKKAGVIDNQFFAKIYIWFKGSASRLQAGEYTFVNKISLARALDRIASPGALRKEVEITFIEGWTIQEMADYISSQEQLNIDVDDFINATGKRFDFTFMAIIGEERTLEGYLFPDTYRVFKDITADELVEKMLKNFEDKLTGEALSEIERQKRNIDDVIILASILEKELLTLEDQKNGADVFLKRIEAGIGLQADSTINYITKKSDPRASATDLEIDSPYNTYKYRGLPPGPISNPGASALEAAIYPSSNPYYYFLTTPDGDAIFNVTLHEHNEDKQKYY